MTPKARAIKDLADACKRLGWEARLHHTGEVQDGLVAGEAGYMELVTGAVDAAEAGGGIRDLPVDNDPCSGLAILESPQEAAVGPDKDLVAPEMGAENRGEIPSAPKSKVVGQILGAVNGKPVGMLSQEAAPEDGPPVVCESVDPDDPIVDGASVLKEEG